MTEGNGWLVLAVVLGLYAFFHHEGDFKDGGTKEKGRTEFAPTGFEPATLGLLVQRFNIKAILSITPT